MRLNTCYRARAGAWCRLCLPCRVHWWRKSTDFAGQPALQATSICANTEVRRSAASVWPAWGGHEAHSISLAMDQLSQEHKGHWSLSFHNHLGPVPHGQEVGEGDRARPAGSWAAGSHQVISPVGRTFTTLACKGGAESPDG